MIVERVAGGVSTPPFPIYPRLADSLVGAYQNDPLTRDATVAHVLGTCAGYAYGEAATVSTMMARLGLDGHACVRISETVDAMLIFSTAYLVQSACGRVVILCYRGTEPGSLGNWLGDADIGTNVSALPMADGAEAVRVHAGFHRNVRATWWPVVQELAVAHEGRSLANHSLRLEHPLQALFVTGHSLGGAMALLFALGLCGSSAYRSIAARLRAVHTFGQPMAVAAALPRAVETVAPLVFRHVTGDDPIPALPPVPWGPFLHIGHEYRHAGAGWQRSDAPIEEMRTLREIPRSLWAFFAPEAKRRRFRYSMAAHGPHHYLAALRPPGRVTELGDLECDARASL